MSIRATIASGATIAAAVVVLATAACGRGDAARDEPADANGDGEALAAAPGFGRRSIPYASRPLPQFGRVSGHIELDGPPPADSILQPASDQLVCGTAFTRQGIARRGNRPVGVVVWIDGIASGKPLPVERRFEITNDRCALVPEIQTAVAGGTLNVRSLDPVEHRTRVTRKDDGSVLATIRETDEGQVVPNDRVLASQGLLELSCDVHPWTRAWIAVFDHPYFAMTGTDGTFTIDSIPPGRYRVHAWHPRLGAIEDSVTVPDSLAAEIVLRAKTGT